MPTGVTTQIVSALSSGNYEQLTNITKALGPEGGLRASLGAHRAEVVRNLIPRYAGQALGLSQAISEEQQLAPYLKGLGPAGERRGAAELAPRPTAVVHGETSAAGKGGPVGITSSGQAHGGGGTTPTAAGGATGPAAAVVAGATSSQNKTAAENAGQTLAESITKGVGSTSAYNEVWNAGKGLGNFTVRGMDAGEPQAGAKKAGESLADGLAKGVEAAATGGAGKAINKAFYNLGFNAAWSAAQGASAGSASGGGEGGKPGHSGSYNGSPGSGAHGISSTPFGSAGKGAFAGLTVERTDQGKDFGGKGAVRAVASGKVIGEGLWNGWPGSGGIVYSTSQGNVYVMEDFANTKKKGQAVKEGEIIGYATGGESGIEAGWANSAGTGPIATYNGAPDGTPEAGGKAFSGDLGINWRGGGTMGSGPDPDAKAKRSKHAKAFSRIAGDHPRASAAAFNPGVLHDALGGRTPAAVGAAAGGVSGVAASLTRGSLKIDIGAIHVGEKGDIEKIADQLAAALEKVLPNTVKEWGF